MEQSKFEREFREKLQSREIMPSENAWNRLDAMLSVTESNPPAKKRSYGWLGMAASFVILFGLGCLFMVSPVKVENEVEVVSEQSDLKIHKVGNNNDVVEGSTFHKNLQTQESQSSQKRVVEKKNVIVGLNKVKNSFESVDKIKESAIVNANEDGLAQSTTPVLVKEEASVTPDEVVLAAKVEMKVDAQALLNQVDGEMKQTFRQNVFKRIKKNYTNAKEVLVSRNQESSINQ